MAKVLRLYKGGLDTITDWKDTNQIDFDVVFNMPEPDGLSDKKIPTSIPSPFAAMDLVNNAFKHLNEEFLIKSDKKHKVYEGCDSYHKLISDSLDVGQIFFEYNKFAQYISITEWNTDINLTKLRNSDYISHKLLGETLKLFIDQDADSFHFKDIKSFYILSFLNGPNGLDILGGTSPTTLFFASGNDLSFAKVLQTPPDVHFDKKYNPLYKRDSSFIEYMYTLQAAIPDFPNKFTHLNVYLENCKSLLKPEIRQKISAISKPVDLSGIYEPITVSAGHTVEIFGNILYKKSNSITWSSDFFIQSTKNNDGKRPMVLPVSKYNEKLIYTSALWNENWNSGDRNDAENSIIMNVPLSDDRPLESRTLPFDRSVYPYLTIDDFLERTIIKTMLPINKECFYDGDFHFDNGVEKDDYGYLLPLKKEFFNYFTVKDLVSSDHRTKPYIEIKKGILGSVHVKLAIPVQKGKYVFYEREYKENTQINSILNDGSISLHFFTVAVSPLFKMENSTDCNYRIGLIDSENSRTSFELNFRNSDNNVINPISVREQANKFNGDPQTIQFYVIENTPFEFIEFKSNMLETGIILPLFKTIKPGNREYSVAVDFGTTNTSIEIKENNDEETEIFQIKEDDKQIAYLHKTDNKLISANNKSSDERKLISMILFSIEKSMPLFFMPTIIGSNTNYSFPTRTCISHRKNMPIGRDGEALGNYNIPFHFERDLDPSNFFDHHTDLKWDSKEQSNEALITYFFSELLFLIRNKILINGGSFEETKIITFFPTSMSNARKDMLENKWKTLTTKFLKGSKHFHVSESIAPFYYLLKKGGVAAIHKPVVHVDIGGGTTDIVVFTENKPLLITSARFAANSIWGDGFNQSKETNGFLLKYKDIIHNEFKNYELFDLENIIIDLEKRKTSDVIAGYFSIENNIKYNSKKLISFNEMLSNDKDLKIVFMLFFSSIMYQIARLLQIKGIEAPANITFSGNGSKILDIIEPSITKKYKNLSKYCDHFFGFFFQNPSITVKSFSEPKRLTGMGGLYARDIAALDTIDKIQETWIGDEKGSLSHSHKIKYRDLDDQCFESVVHENFKFLKLFEECNEIFPLNKHFSISMECFEDIKSILNKEKAIEYIKIGVDNAKSETISDPNEPVFESLFFYPMIGGLNDIAHSIYEKTKTDNNE